LGFRLAADSALWLYNRLLSGMQVLPMYIMSSQLFVILYILPWLYRFGVVIFCNCISSLTITYYLVFMYLSLCVSIYPLRKWLTNLLTKKR
jgi:hypothetical protein